MASKPAMQVGTNQYATTPTSGDIHFHLARVTPLEREAAAAQFLGLRVYWPARFFDATSLTGGVFQLTFSPRGMHSHMTRDHNIYANHDPARWPELHGLQRGRRVDLWGTIREVDWMLGVTLELDRLEVLPESLTDKLVEVAERSSHLLSLSAPVSRRRVDLSRIHLLWLSFPEGICVSSAAEEPAAHPNQLQ